MTVKLSVQFTLTLKRYWYSGYYTWLLIIEIMVQIRYISIKKSIKHPSAGIGRQGILKIYWIYIYKRSIRFSDNIGDIV